MNKDNLKAILLLAIMFLFVFLQFVVEEYNNVMNDPNIKKELYAILEIEKERLGVAFYIITSIYIGSFMVYNVCLIVKDLLN